jgi:nucleotide-binding universal stress UspA family protein
MLTLKKILLATDFSDCARTAEQYSLAFASQFQAELHVLNVVIDTVMMTPESGTSLLLAANYLDEIKNQSKAAVDRIVAAAVKQGLACIGETRLGNPPFDIVNYATEHGIDLIIVGTHGRGGFMHLLLGSCAEKVVRKAQCPVLTVHPAGHQFVTRSA